MIDCFMAIVIGAGGAILLLEKNYDHGLALVALSYVLVKLIEIERRAQ